MYMQVGFEGQRPQGTSDRFLRPRLGQRKTRKERLIPGSWVA